MRVLAGDIGGTKSIFQIVESDLDQLQVRFEAQYKSTEFTDALPLVQRFLESSGSEAKEVRFACIAIPGPIRILDNGSQVANLTNLPWTVHDRELSQKLGFRTIRLINDFQSVGYGIDALNPSDIFTLQKGQKNPTGLRAIIGAGTGLGQTLLVWQGSYYESYPSEGGHCDFSPTDEQQISLLRFIRKEKARVSLEDVVSGPGLVRIYRFLAQDAENPKKSLEVVLNSPDSAACITQLALNNSDDLADKALNLFIRIYGIQAGNLALTCIPTGGLYIAGGIAPKIIGKFKEKAFLKAITDRPKMRHLLQTIPIYLITNPKVGVLGAALVATRLGSISAKT